MPSSGGVGAEQDLADELMLPDDQATVVDQLPMSDGDELPALLAPQQAQSSRGSGPHAPPGVAQPGPGGHKDAAQTIMGLGAADPNFLAPQDTPLAYPPHAAGKAPVGRAPVGKAPVAPPPVGKSPVGEAPSAEAPTVPLSPGKAPTAEAPTVPLSPTKAPAALLETYTGHSSPLNEATQSASRRPQSSPRSGLVAPADLPRASRSAPAQAAPPTQPPREPRPAPSQPAAAPQPGPVPRAAPAQAQPHPQRRATDSRPGSGPSPLLLVILWVLALASVGVAIFLYFK